MPFDPRFQISSSIASSLMRIEAAREALNHLPINPTVLAALRETARLYSTHYSTMIEGNRLTQEQVVEVIEKEAHFPGRDRDEKEVLGYYAGLDKVEQIARQKQKLREEQIQLLHALVMAGGATKVKPTPYRDGQNVIRDGRSRRIVYLPPEARDVPILMTELVSWLGFPVKLFQSERGHSCPQTLRVANSFPMNQNPHPSPLPSDGRGSRRRSTVHGIDTGKLVERCLLPALSHPMGEGAESASRNDLPCPIRAGIAHYQFATIHPYYDGNGRTARLLATLILHLGGYDLKGLYSLEEYYARDLSAYYEALTVGPSHNYYLGRAESDITGWIDYFCAGMAESFESVKRKAEEAAGRGGADHTSLLRELDPRQRKALSIFRRSAFITSRDIEKLFSISQRSARHLLGQWVEKDFLMIIDPAKKSRKYGLSLKFSALAANDS